MPSYKHFEELPVWKEGAKLYNRVLDLLEDHPKLLSAGFRNQIDRAALSVPNNIAEGFDRITTGELATFLGYARGSASEVMSMCATVTARPKLKPALPMLREIRQSAESCLRQLSAWASQIEKSPVQGKRHRAACA
jgi:four helix bundle protein